MIMILLFYQGAHITEVFFSETLNVVKQRVNG